MLADLEKKESAGLKATLAELSATLVELSAVSPAHKVEENYRRFLPWPRSAHRSRN